MTAPEWPLTAASGHALSAAADARVLCVGAGGIGCELLKTLVLSGFRDITVVDMDTIETSNLNRQFLFRKHHVGQYKAEVAADAVMKMVPGAKVTARHGNIKDSEFNVDWFRGFHIVLNGLDNLDARRHVNRMCLSAGIPLLESGTNGYQGQVSVHIKGSTECFECTPKPAPKSFPVCTIRNTPEKPIHCVVWAKDLLFPRLFGPSEQTTDLDERSEVPTGEAGAAASVEGAAGTADENDAGQSFFVKSGDENPESYARRVFERVYKFDIERVLRMEDLWRARAKPTPLDLDALVPRAESEASQGGSPGATLERLTAKPRETWTAEDSARVFLACIGEYHGGSRGGELGRAVFDKDDDVAVAFVTAASNLRAACYGIQQQSLFECKGMAGNIIHAIATTNAIVAGLMVIEATKILTGNADKCVGSVLTPFGEQRAGFRGKIIVGHKMGEPSEACIACGRPEMTLKIDTATATLSDFVTKVAKGRLGIARAYVDCPDTDLIYEEGSDLEEDEVSLYQGNLKRTLADLPGKGIKDGSVITLEDHLQDMTVNVRVQHVASLDPDEFPDGFDLQGQAPSAKRADATPSADVAGPSGAQTGDKAEDGNAESDSDMEVVMDGGQAGPPGAGGDADSDLEIVAVGEDHGEERPGKRRRVE